MRQLVIVGLACAAIPAKAVMAVFSGTAALQVGIETSVLKYFGPQANVVEASAIFLESSALCDPREDVVRGKVAIGTTYGTSSCNYMVAYRRLDALGALGFVIIVQISPPGWTSVFDYDVWDSSETRGMAMTMVEVFNANLVIGPEVAANTTDFRVSISPTHNTEWEEAATSVSWLIMIRIITPMFTLFFISWPGFNEAWSLWWALGRDGSLALAQIRAASFAVCLIASVCSFVICILLVLGQYAAQMAPFFIHKFFYTTFVGTSALSTSISCAVLFEKYRGAPPRNLPLRVLTKQYPSSLALVTLLCPGMDFLMGYFRVSGLDEGVGLRRFQTAAAAVTCLIQGGFSLVFLY